MVSVDLTKFALMLVLLGGVLAISALGLPVLPDPNPPPDNPTPTVRTSRIDSSQPGTPVVNGTPTAEIEPNPHDTDLDAWEQALEEWEADLVEREESLQKWEAWLMKNIDSLREQESYLTEQLAELQAERDKLAQEREELRAERRELEQARQQLQDWEDRLQEKEAEIQMIRRWSLVAVGVTTVIATLAVAFSMDSALRSRKAQAEAKKLLQEHSTQSRVGAGSDGGKMKVSEPTSPRELGTSVMSFDWRDNGQQRRAESCR